eukprot:IDg1544t1
MARPPRLTGANREHWLFFTDDVVHQPPLGNDGYHIVAHHERGVRLDWNRVFSTGYFSTPPSNYDDVPGMVIEGPFAFHHPEYFWSLRSLRTDAELFAFAPWLDPGVVSNPPRWLLQYASDGYFPGDMAISVELVPSVTYRRGVCVDIDDFSSRHRRDPIAYCRALYLQRYFHVRRPASRADGIENLCDEWLVCADWEPDYVRRVAGILLQEDPRDLEVRHPRDLRASLDFMCLPRLLDEDFRSEPWSTQKDTTCGRRYQRRRWRQRLERTSRCFVSMRHEELNVLSPAAISRRVPPMPAWWQDEFCGSDRLPLEGCPFAAFWPTRLFRPTFVDWAFMITEVVFVSALGFLRAAYAERRLYRFSPRLYREWLALSDHWASLIGGWVDFYDLKSLARIGLDVPWDELRIDFSVGYISFDPWARIFIAYSDDNVRNIRPRVRLHAGVGGHTDGWSSRDVLTDFNGTIPDDLAPLYRVRYDWTEAHGDPARLPPMLCRQQGSRAWRLMPGPLRHGRLDSEVDEVRSLAQLSWRACYPRFPRVSAPVLKGWVHLFRSNNQELLVDVPEHVEFDDIPHSAAEVVEVPPLVVRKIPVIPDVPPVSSGDEIHPSTFQEFLRGTEREVRRSERNARRRGVRVRSPDVVVPAVRGRRQATRRSKRLGVQEVDEVSPVVVARKPVVVATSEDPPVEEDDENAVVVPSPRRTRLSIRLVPQESPGMSSLDDDGGQADLQLDTLRVDAEGTSVQSRDSKVTSVRRSARLARKRTVETEDSEVPELSPQGGEADVSQPAPLVVEDSGPDGEAKAASVATQSESRLEAGPRQHGEALIATVSAAVENLAATPLAASKSLQDESGLLEGSGTPIACDVELGVESAVAPLAAQDKSRPKPRLPPVDAPPIASDVALEREPTVMPPVVQGDRQVESGSPRVASRSATPLEVVALGHWGVQPGRRAHSPGPMPPRKRGYYSQLGSSDYVRALASSNQPGDNPATPTPFGALRTQSASADGPSASSVPPFGELRVTIEPLDASAADWAWSGVLTLQRRSSIGAPTALGRSLSAPDVSVPVAPPDEAGGAFHPGSSRQLSRRLKRHVTRTGNFADDTMATVSPFGMVASSVPWNEGQGRSHSASEAMPILTLVLLFFAQGRHLRPRGVPLLSSAARADCDLRRLFL